MTKLGEKHYEVKITVKKEGTSQEEKEPEYISCVPQGQKNTVVVISSDKMGDGDPELGQNPDQRIYLFPDPAGKAAGYGFIL